MTKEPDVQPRQEARAGVDLADPAARAEWLRAAHEHARDLAAAALDQVAPPLERDLGPRQARRIITDAANALDAMFAAAEPVSSSGTPDTPT